MVGRDGRFSTVGCGIGKEIVGPETVRPLDISVSSIDPTHGLDVSSTDVVS